MANAASPRLRWRQAATLLLLFTGYAAYYFCRSDYSVAMPLLIDDLSRHGFSHDAAVIRLGAIASFGVLAYAAGKLCLAGVADLWGGKRSLTLGLGGAVAFTLLFASAGTVPLFTAAWVGNRLVQSIGWAGLVKVSSKWFSYASYGRIMGLLSLSYLIGDAAAREWMGSLIGRGYSWQALFYFAAAVATAIVTLNLIFLRESRTEMGLAEPDRNPLNLFADASTAPRSVWALVRPLLGSRGFILVCLLSLGTTIVRETFNTWTPVYFTGALGYPADEAARLSAVFPLVGALSVLLSGWASDRAGVTGRASIMAVGLAVSTVALLGLASLHGGSEAVIAIGLVGLVAFALLGPYAYLAGACALDFGGEHAGAISSGLIDAAGYFGGVVAGDTVARAAVRFGWQGVFVLLAAVSALSAVAALSLLIQQRTQERARALARPAASGVHSGVALRSTQEEFESNGR